MRWYMLLSAGLLALFALASPTTARTARAQGGIGGSASGSGGDCAFVGSGQDITEVIEQQIGNTGGSCTGTVNVYQSFGPSDSGQNGMCTYGLIGLYDCNTQIFTAVGDWQADNISPEFVDAPCDFGGSGSRYKSCEINQWTGQLTCGFWKWDLQVQAGLPCATLDIEPYPATMVRWPTYLRFSGAGSSSASASIDFVGRGTLEHPLPGDQKDIRLTLSIRPLAPQMQVYLPRAGYYQGEGKRCAEIGMFVLPLQSSISPPRTVICWNVPSHPDAGAGALAGGVSGMDELPGDFPLFVGWARVPYQAEWHVSYWQWDVVDRYCVYGPKSDGTYECSTVPGGPANGHWVEVYDWRRHNDGGVIDPAAIQGLPSSLLADLNKDGQPDAFWSYAVRIRRMNEAWQVNDPVWGREWVCRDRVYFGVREGQSQSIYLKP